MYLTGFGNYHQTEAIPGALPSTQNSPQQCPLGLYAEQLSGSSFTQLRERNLHSWLYRKHPSVAHEDYLLDESKSPFDYAPFQPPNPFRWLPLTTPSSNHDFIDGLFHVGGNSLLAVYLYQANQSMIHRYFSNHDGEMLFVPYQGNMEIFTEFGALTLTPGQIAVVPRGIKFKIKPTTSNIAGYLCENSGVPLHLPTLGIIGANGLANPRHFLYPQAAFEEEDLTESVQLICKYQHRFWSARSKYSPLNVVAWHGNYAPYSYDLSLFNTINTVSFDHPDPSIFTVLTSESTTPHTANLDFAIFPSRWLVSNHSFRPPYFHRNIMNEFMGLIFGEYEAKQEGFLPGGMSIHNCMTAHGPDYQAFHKASTQKLKPIYLKDTLAFMFETNEPWQISKNAFSHPARQLNYSECWQGL